MMKNWKKYCVLIAVALLMAACSDIQQNKPLAAAGEKLSYTETIATLLNSNCVECHRLSTGPGDTGNTGYSVGKYDLSNYFGLFGNGTDDQPNLVAGNASSLMLSVLQSADSSYHQLPNSADFTALRNWVVDDSAYYGRAPYVHPQGWTNPASDNFHGTQIKLADWNLEQCQSCHGTDWAGGKVDVSCFNCHAKPGGPENCNTCHGNFTGSPTDTTNWAPPRDLSGNESTTAAGVGAHQFHLSESMNRVTDAIPCRSCHIVPESISTPTHIKGRPAATDSTDDAEVNFSGLAVKTSDNGAIVPAPIFDEASGSCSNTYCHGEFKNGLRNNTKIWTDINTDPVTDCSACHGQPPSGDHPQGTWVEQNCYACHNSVVDENKMIISRSLHVNGQVDRKSLHADGWADPASPEFHGLTIAASGWDLSTCKTCHGTDYAGGESGKSCMDSGCHSSPKGPENCNTCHGDFTAAASDTTFWAPPEDLLGNSATSFIGVGAHRQHLTDNELRSALNCIDCHILPETFDAATHIEGALPAEITFGALATTETDSIPGPFWVHDQAGCSNVYCHGQFKNGNKNRTMVWNEVGTGQAECGTCHNLPPGGTHEFFIGACSNCHFTVVNPDTTFLDQSKHMNGEINVFGSVNPWK